MKENGLTRVVTLTGNLALMPSDTLRVRDRVAHTIVGLAPVLHTILKDGEEHIRLLGESEPLDWTCVRAPQITANGSKGYRLGLRPVPWAPISRTAVAHCLVDLAEGTG
jgi:hypothetical protein